MCCVGQMREWCPASISYLEANWTGGRFLFHAQHQIHFPESGNLIVASLCLMIGLGPKPESIS